MRLAIEAATPLGGVAIARGSRLLAEVTVGVQSRHSAALLPAIEYALRLAELEPRAVAGVVVGAGPGSFTGVRVAAATAKGLVRGLGVPLFAYSSLAALAATAAQSDRPVCALFDARRNEVYMGCYRFPDFSRCTTLLAPTALPIGAAIEAGIEHGAVFVGEAAELHEARIRAAGGQLTTVLHGAPRAGALLWLAALASGHEAVREPGRWEPLYLRPSGAERQQRS